MTRKRIETPDHDFLDLDFLDFEKEAPLVVVLHGLEGSSDARYIQSLMGVVRARGWRGVAVNLRGCSGEQNRQRYSYHAGKSEDLDFVVNYLIQREKVTSIYLVGFSLGGNMLLKWLGESGGQVPKQVMRAAVVSVPFDLAKSTEIMDRGFHRAVYTSGMLKTLKVKALEKEKQFPGCVDIAKVRRARTFGEFDSYVTAPVNGIESAMTYWIQSSAIHYLDQIRVPTLVIHAEDDPFFPGRLLPREKWKASNYLQAVVTSSGGHLGFVSGAWPWQQELWLENSMLGFFNGTH
ncbi:MAG: alpha/beta fold hydrolase [Candidatus Omnitrophica bacterium]|nr:alpha/beta fold hydrolase [Candidatus Omnitrophota bacterium]